MNAKPLAYDLGMPPTGHKVSNDRLDKFRRVYKETYGEDITKAEAVEMTHGLLALYTLVLRPLPDEPSRRPPSSPLAQSADAAT